MEDGYEGSPHLLVSKLEQRRHGVGPRRQDEDERGAAVAVGEGLAQVEGRGFDEATSQRVTDKLLHHGNDLYGGGGAGAEGVGGAGAEPLGPKMDSHTVCEKLTLSGRRQRMINIF